MLTPDMIWEDIHLGDELEAQGNHCGAFHKYCRAETAFDSEEEAECIIGDPEAFEKAIDAARLRRQRVWNHLTDNQKREVASLLDKYRGYAKKDI